MNVIEIEIRNKIAKTISKDEYVCGNSDYMIRFSFDEEWDQYDTKTARIINGDGEYYDQVFTGCECPMPIISKAYAIKVGVFAGNLHTTTPAYVPAVKSILCDGGSPANPPEDVYHQIMEMLKSSGVNPEAIESAVKQYLDEHPITFEESDPNVPEWAKQPEPPTYTAEDVGALPADTPIPEPYSLPVASADTLGGVKVGKGLKMNGETINVSEDNDLKLIKTIVVEDDEIIEYVLGDVYLDKVLTTVTAPASGFANASNIFQYCWLTGANTSITVGGTYIATSVMYGSNFETYKQRGMWKSECRGGSYSSGTSDIKGPGKVDQLIPAADESYIANVRIYTYNAAGKGFPKDTVINIYGVKHNA